MDSDGRPGDEKACLDPLPLNAVETADRLVGELGEGAGGEVEVEHGTAGAAVDSHDLDGLALVGSPDHPLADRVVVGVAASVTRVLVV